MGLGLLIGCCWITSLNQLPSIKLMLFVNIAILSLYGVILLNIRNFIIHLCMIFILSISLGLSWSTYQSHKRLAWVLPTEQIRQPIEVTGTVQGLPIKKGGQTHFELALDLPKNNYPVIRLFWAHATHTLVPGDKLKLKVVLMPPHTLSNPGSFDVEKQSFLMGVRAIGTVKTVLKYEPQLGLSFAQTRYNLFENIKKQLKNLPFKGIMVALIVGDKTDITPAQWQVLQKTGTSHLVAISGLHVSMIAGAVFFLSSWLWRKGYKAYSRLHYISAQKVGAISAILSAGGYAALAGWSIPTQRAFIMVAIAMLGGLLQRKFSPWFLYFMALILVLFIMPLAPLMAGFWLSFLAVGSLIFVFSGWTYIEKSWTQKWLAPQWVVFVALLPLGFLFFQQTTIIGPLANFIAIPFTSLLIVPLDLLGAFFLVLIPDAPSIGHFFLHTAHLLWSGLWVYLEILAHWPYSMIAQGYFTTGSIVLAGLGCVLLLMPKGLPGRYLGWIAWLPLFLGKAPVPQLHEMWFSLLEVGQGLCAVIQTKNHILVYDTGPRFGQDLDAGSKVIVPFLKSQGIDHIDTIVISHSDLDHRGGLRSLLNFYQPTNTLTPNPEKVPEIQSQPCQAGQHWHWDGIDFEILSPRSDADDRLSKKFLKTNNQSCVLKVTTGSNSILLTGDIEAVVEDELVNTIPQMLKARILVVPHHGSKGSSTQAFVDHVAPEYALFPVGYYNHYGFPKACVVERYQSMGANPQSNAVQGMIQFRFNHLTQDLHPTFFRVCQSKFWNRV